MTGLDRAVPHDTKAEMDTLGALILDRDGIIQIADFLRADDFYMEQHRIIYAAILSLYQRKEPPDASTLASELLRLGKLEHVGNYSYLTELTIGCPTAVHIEYYAHTVERCSVMRRLISAGGEIAAVGYDTQLSADEALQKAQQKVMQVATRKGLETGVEMAGSVNEFLDFLDNVQENHTGITGLATGLTDLDSRTGGFQRGELVIIAGRPGRGKTCLATCIGLEVAKQGKEVAMYELEMTRADLIKRMVSRETEIDFQQLRTGKMNSEQFSQAGLAAANLAEIGFYIDDSAAVDIMQLGVKAFKRKAAAGMDLLIVDYLQLVRSTKRGATKEQEVAEVSQGLKILAKSLDIPVIACAQLNRAVESRPSGRAQLSDLRESGQIENDADIVMFIHQDENGPKSVADLDLVKHRSGPKGDVSVYYDAATMTFDNLYRNNVA